MNTDKLVSIVIPVYNAEAHIRKTLTSIIAQDYEHIEIIIVNDASTDSSPLIAKTMLENSRRTFRIINHSQNLGVSAARNTGLKSAKGKYIWFCDSDDLAAKNFVSALVSEAETKEAEIVFCSFRHYYEDDNRYEAECLSRTKLTKESFSGEECLKLFITRKISFRSVWNCIFAKHLLEKIRLHFFEKCRLGEDEEFLMKAVVSASKVSHVEDVLYTYVHHPQQSVRQYGRVDKKLEMSRHVMLSRFRTGRCIRNNAQSKFLKTYAANFLPADNIVKMFTLCAQINDHKLYRKMLKTLRHKRVRKLMLSSARFIITKPELFFKSLMLLYAPNLYYMLRKGR